MEKISDIKFPIRRKEVFKPDFTDLNRLYSTGVAMNDIDIALRKRELQDTISSMLFDVSHPQPPELEDDLLLETYVGKELETSDLYAYCKHLEGEILKQRDNKD